MSNVDPLVALETSDPLVPLREPVQSGSESVHSLRSSLAGNSLMLPR